MRSAVRSLPTRASIASAHSSSRSLASTRGRTRWAGAPSRATTPGGWQLLALVQNETAEDDDIYVFTNLAGVGSMEVNAFQRACDIVISDPRRREAFGQAAREHVRREYLLPRLLRDELALISGVLGASR
jgi:hypothetical protein